MIYKYVGIDKNGRKVSNKIQASSEEAVKQKLRAEKIIYRSIKQEDKSFLDSIEFKKKYIIPVKELSALSREISMYIGAGMTIVSALKIVQTHYENNKKLLLFLKTISTALDEGKNFYTALDIQTIVVLPNFFKESIKVSESSGILDEVLLELSRFLKEQDKLNKEIKSAFAYPAFMLVISVFMVAFMLTFVVPKITEMFDSMDQALPPITVFVVSLGDFLNTYYLLILITIGSLIATYISLMKMNKHFKYAVHKFFLSLPLFGAIILKSELARFAYISSLLVRSGVTYVQTISLSANILDNSVLKDYFLKASAKVVEGKKLSSALIEVGYKYDKAFITSIALGEETSQIKNVLSNVSELYFEENREKMGILLSLLEPVLMLFVGGSIGFIVAAMLLPIFSMSIA
jgi:general secretion pathway protein F/type IV pilus assembly protein PilC